MTILKNIAWGILGLFVFMFAAIVVVAIIMDSVERQDSSEVAGTDAEEARRRYIEVYQTLVPWNASELDEPELITEELYQPCVASLTEYIPDMKLQEEILFTHFSALVYPDALTVADGPEILGRHWGTSASVNGQVYKYYCDLTWGHWIHSDYDARPVAMLVGIDDPLEAHSQRKKVYHVSDEQYALFIKTWDTELLGDEYRKIEELFDRAVRRYNIDNEYTFDHCRVRAMVLDYWSRYDQHIRNLRASYDAVDVYPAIGEMPLLDDIYERYDRWASNNAVKQTIKDSYRDRKDMIQTCGRGHSEWDNQWKNLIDEIAQSQ